MSRDPVADARAIVRERFPQAVWAVVTGSVLTAARTPGSDLDVVVLLPDGDPDAPHRDSARIAGWPVECFVHDAETLERYLAQELSIRKPTLHRMVGTGTAVAGDPGPVQRRCAAVLAAGPAPLTADEVDRLRYALTDLVDDLTHVVDDGERATLTPTAWLATGDAALRLGRHWSGHGKWLLRELRDMDADLAGEWLAAAGDPARVIRFAGRVLAPVGGPLFDGYRAAGERPRREPEVPLVQITALTEAGGRPGWLAAAPDGTPLGTGFLRLPSGPLTVHVHPAERRRGVGSRLLGAAAAAVREHGRPVVTEVVEAGSPGDRFFAARGLRQVLALTYTRLDLAAAVAEPQPKPGYELVSWWGTVPDRWAASFAASRRAMDDMPMDDAAVEPELWDVDRVRAVAAAVQRRGEHLLTVAAVDAGGEIAGFTELVVPVDGAGDGMNYGTGVLPAHRGQGLARWMKAESIRLVRARFPHLGGLIADTADSNTVMRAVNERLGYVPTHRCLMYQLEPEAPDHPPRSTRHWTAG